jgi:hypothetical protein
MKLRWRHALVLAGLAACRSGGPSADPGEYVASAAAGGDAAGGSVPPGDEGNAEPPPSDDTGPTSDDAAGPTSDDGGSPTGDDADEAGSVNLEGGTCSPPPTVAGCDPVHNTGCSSAQQCDVNPLSATGTLMGMCVFGSNSDAAPCLGTAYTESCPAKSTCVAAACRQLCFCDSDCPSGGQCCTDPSGPPGFKVCGGSCR